MNYQQIFPDRREEGKTILEKVKIVELRILKIFNHICNKHNINYFAICGTLLGTIRHKGFIPWDDDVDVIMPREDYEKFVEVVKEELPSDLFWQDTNTDNFPYFRMLFGKIRDTNSQIEKNEDYNNGIYIDIFVLETVSTDLKKAKSQKKYLNFLCHLDFLKNNKSFMQQIRIKKLASKNVLLKGSIWFSVYLMSIFLKIFDMPGFLRKRYYKKVNKQEHSYYFLFGKYFEFTEEDIFPIRKMKFEDMDINVNNNCHKYLKEFYGDYMKFPPKHLRKPEHIIKETVV